MSDYVKTGKGRVYVVAHKRGLNITDTTPPSHRPPRRGDCPRKRPCPYVSCKYHLFLDVLDNGNIKVNFPDILQDYDCARLPETCSLDVSDRGEQTLEEVAIFMNLTRERVRQIESNALEKLKRRAIKAGLSADDIVRY